MKNKTPLIIVVSYILLFAVSCKKEEQKPPVAASISLVSGNNQQSEAQTPLPLPIEIEVKDQYGNLFEGTTLTIVTNEGEGVVSPLHPKTNSNGKAGFIWVLGKNEGVQELLITAQNDQGIPLSGSPVAVTATATPKPPVASSIELISGTGQTGIVNEALPLPVEVRVKDQHGQAFSGADVNFSVVEGSLSLSGTQTDANGRASVIWTLGAGTGMQKLTVTALQDGSTMALYGSPLTVTAGAHAPTNIALQPITFPTDIRGAAVNALFPNPFVAVVKDENGNLLEGAKVTFSVAEGFLFPLGDNVGRRFTTVNTDVNGQAKVMWQLGPVYGTQTIEASVTAVDGTALTTVLNIIGMLSDAEGNLYQTIEMGNQLWMAENLRSTKYNDGTEIPYISDSYNWENNTSNPAYCWYYNSAYEYKQEYGALYNWHVISTEKICPSGWHIPTDAEWSILVSIWGGESQAGGKLKEAGTAHWKSPNTGATNESGFRARPGGLRDYKGVYHGTDNKIGSYGYWWSATVKNNESSWAYIMYYNNSTILRHSANKQTGYSLRCIKDR